MHDIYKHNWYKRNEKTYNYGNPVNVLERFTDGLYSSIEVKDMLNNYSKISAELKSIISARFKINPKIEISDVSEDSYTDGRGIMISTKHTEDITDNFKKLDLLYGFAFHEAAHCVYTDFDCIRRQGMLFNPLTKFIHNILEDEEIELRMTKANLGYGKYFAYLKHIIFENGTCAKTKVQEKAVNNLDEIMTILFCLVRFPKYIEFIDNAVLDKYVDLFIKLNDIMVNCDCPMVVPFTSCDMYEESYYDKQNITGATTKATFEIYKYIQKYLAEDFKNQEKEFDENENSIGNQYDTFGMPSGANETEKTNEAFHSFNMLNEDVYSGSTIGDFDETKISNDRVRTPNPEKYWTMFNSMRKFYDIASRTVIPNDVKLKDNLVLNRFRRNGNLDTNRLPEAMQNINTIYSQKVNRPTKVNNEEPKFAFVMMIDESGSMEGGLRNEYAYKIAVLYAEIFSKFKGVEFYVYGHGDRINSYMTKEKQNKFVLANFDKQGGQNDAFSYNWIINDVKRQTNLPIILLNITDFYYHSADKDLERVIKSFRNNNVSFNMICVGGRHTPREEAFTKRLLQGQVFNISSFASDEINMEMFEELSVMIRKNYERFNRK